jgi:hypothetical protein
MKKSRTRNRVQRNNKGLHRTYILDSFRR